MVGREVLYLLLLILKVEANSNSVEVKSTTCHTQTCDHSDLNSNSESFKESIGTCSLYLAESSIPNGGLGIFSAIDIPEGGIIGNPELVIPIVDTKLSGLFGSYTWRGFDHTSNNEAEDVNNICPGVMAMGNGHSGLANVWGGSNALNDEAGLHRSKDPGAGAFTTYHNLQSEATVPIEAGMELLIDYGDNWYDTRKDYKNLPRSFHYEEADHKIQKFSKLLNEENGISRDALEKFWAFVRSSNDDIINEILPNSIEELEKAIEKGSARYDAPKNFIRPVEWLTTEGLCLDNLREGDSTIPQAGRGAFATRMLPKGSLVAPAPLIHICDSNDYMFEDDKEQLLLNYCFGHRSSSILLCPYGSGNSLINHSSEQANAEIHWSTSRFHSNDWLERTAEEICNEPERGLMFDIIAKRDILPGEEVFLHYGQEWEDAWNAHVEEWQQPEDSENYISAHALNQTELVLKTHFDEVDFRYPENVFTECYIPLNFEEDFPDANTKTVYHKDYDGYVSNHDLLHCILVRRESNNGTDFYKVAITMTNDDETFYKMFVHDVPREAIKFSNHKYTSDMFLEDAFRHEIMISDEIFPESWKDLDHN